MTLQPLLENAIKHGIRQVDGGGTIAVDALVRDGWLHISVVNPVAPDAAPPSDHGVGLRNIRERLAVLYGPRARIAWQRTDQQFAIEINLPADKEHGA
jgi:sensor histidine kinase YesM